jgi:hypothetical protein
VQHHFHHPWHKFGPRDVIMALMRLAVATTEMASFNAAFRLLQRGAKSQL